MKDYEILSMEADRIYDTLNNKEDLVKYVDLMRNLLATNPPERYWENLTLDWHLEALIAYLPDDSSTHQSEHLLSLADNRWQLFALLIGAAAIYE